MLAGLVKRVARRVPRLRDGQRRVSRRCVQPRERRPGRASGWQEGQGMTTTAGRWRARWPWSPGRRGASAGRSPCGWRASGAEVAVIDVTRAGRAGRGRGRAGSQMGAPRARSPWATSPRRPMPRRGGRGGAGAGPAWTSWSTTPGITRDGLLRAHGRGRLGRGAGREPQGRLPHEQGGAARHDQAAPRLHRQHLERGRPARQRRPGQLLGRQGRAHRPHEVAGARSGVAQRAGERGGARATSRPR